MLVTTAIVEARLLSMPISKLSGSLTPQKYCASSSIPSGGIRRLKFPMKLMGMPEANQNTCRRGVLGVHRRTMLVSFGRMAIAEGVMFTEGAIGDLGGGAEMELKSCNEGY